MPVQKVAGGFRWGNTGKVYRGKGARAKARRQGAAIKAAQNRRRKPGRFSA